MLNAGRMQEIRTKHKIATSLPVDTEMDPLMQGGYMAS